MTTSKVNGFFRGLDSVNFVAVGPEVTLMRYVDRLSCRFVDYGYDCNRKVGVDVGATTDGRCQEVVERESIRV